MFFRSVEMLSKQVEMFFRSVEMLSKQVEMFFRSVEMVSKQVEMFSQQVNLFFRSVNVFSKWFKMFFKQVGMFFRLRAKPSQTPSFFEKPGICSESLILRHRSINFLTPGSDPALHIRSLDSSVFENRKGFCRSSA